MTWKKYSPALGTAALAAIVALVLVRYREARRDGAGVEERAPRGVHSVALTPRRPARPPRTERAAGPDKQRPQSPPSPATTATEVEVAEAPRTWEGKDMRDYTWEERQATGLTNEKLYAFSGAAHWNVLANELRGQADPSMIAEMESLVTAYREATVPYAYEDTELNVADEKAMLQRLEAAIPPDDLSSVARSSFDFLKAHSVMWETGEAEKLVDNKIQRENDKAKHLALSSRSKEEEEMDRIERDDGDDE